MTEKCKPYEYARRNFEGLAPLTYEVRAITKPILGTRGFATLDIISAWSEIIGKDLAQGISPEKITFPPSQQVHGTLHVKSAGGAFAMLFEHQKARVLDRINTYFGYPAISQIKIQQGSLKLKPQEIKIERELSLKEEEELQKKIASIDDPELKEQTYNIGKEILLKK